MKIILLKFMYFQVSDFDYLCPYINDSIIYCNVVNPSVCLDGCLECHPKLKKFNLISIAKVTCESQLLPTGYQKPNQLEDLYFVTYYD